MNIAVINIKDILRLAVKLMLLILIFFILKNIKFNKIIKIKEEAHAKYIDEYLGSYKYFNKSQKKLKLVNSEKILSSELGILDNKYTNQENIIKTQEDEINSINETVENTVYNLPDNITTQTVEEKNIKAKVTNIYEGVEINNQSDYELTEEMLNGDFEIKDKNDIYIYHTHTCESYTPSENFLYEMTGNYRTTDLNYTVARVGTELTNYLKNKGFNVTHNTTYHDYPSYSGSYDRSLDTIRSELGNSDTEIVIDLHRDAVGEAGEYGPTVKINDMYAAQLMLVIGTDGGGLEHPNWLNNLKFAIKVQKVANEMYPGLFRPIILRNYRYNQHIRNSACIIEVGATGNTMEQCFLSMQCLANVMAKVCSK